MPNMYLKRPAETLGIAALTPTYAIAAGGSRRPKLSRLFLAFQPRHQRLQHGLRLRVEKRNNEIT